VAGGGAVHPLDVLAREDAGFGPAGPRLYGELAAWWPLLSHPDDYVEEAAFIRGLIENAVPEARTLLELGSGGGNNASHLKARFEMTLVDRSPGMLAVSRALNPECRHAPGDMRDVRLGRTFDAVLIHDAIMYLTSRDDLRLAIATAFAHCRPGGVAVFVPDCVRESFAPGTTCGGHDAVGDRVPSRGLRYVQWTWDPDPGDETYLVEFAYLLRDGGDPVRVERDRHALGLFEESTWLSIMTDAGFEARVLDYEPAEHGPGRVFVGIHPGGEA